MPDHGRGDDRSPVPEPHDLPHPWRIADLPARTPKAEERKKVARENRAYPLNHPAALTDFHLPERKENTFRDLLQMVPCNPLASGFRPDQVPLAISGDRMLRNLRYCRVEPRG